MIRGIVFSDENMKISAAKCCESLHEHGCEQVFHIDSEYLKQFEFYAHNQEILDQPRGVGYWLWKPYLIYSTLVNEQTKEGDTIFYSDAGIRIISSLRALEDLMNLNKEEVLLFGNRWKHIEWCKMDVIRGINGLQGFQRIETQTGDFINAAGYEQYTQLQASNIMIKKTEFSLRFVKEWMLYGQMPGYIDDSPGHLPNYPTFQEHRHDQAILTCLKIKYGLQAHWFPSTTNLDVRWQYPHDTYPPIFDHHRKRDNEW